MSHYKHITIEERETILISKVKGHSIRKIAKELSRSPSTILRELRRNAYGKNNYSPVNAEKKYLRRRKRCVKKKLLLHSELRKKVLKLFIEMQWSPEQIVHRLKLEQYEHSISYATIYRGLYAGMLESRELTMYERGNVLKLRHKGKNRKNSSSNETRGKIKVGNSIHDRPEEADSRSVIGHWEADTVAGTLNSDCAVTMVDMCSRYLMCKKSKNRKSLEVNAKILEMFSEIPKKYAKTITPDRGKEFALHEEVSKALERLEFYFADPSSPWQRGSNENTNGLLREYLPKKKDMSSITDEEVEGFVFKLNTRPRKCLGWRTPFEVFWNKVLHLI